MKFLYRAFEGRQCKIFTYNITIYYFVLWKAFRVHWKNEATKVEGYSWYIHFCIYEENMRDTIANRGEYMRSETRASENQSRTERQIKWAYS